MQLSDFHYHLPEELIAHYPLQERSASRLLCLESGTGDIQHRVFSELPDLINEQDLLVFNNTRVIPARLLGHKETGGRVEVLIERLVAEDRAIAQIRASKTPKPGASIYIEEKPVLQVEGREGDFFVIRSVGGTFDQLLAQAGHMPLPPYIERQDEALDRERYQTVFAREPGAVAAPTAGLHFDDRILGELQNKGVDMAFVTLHVGAGTFQPVRVDTIEQHKMHAEYIEVDEQVCAKINAARERGGRVIAVGTTSVRSLETAALKSAESGKAPGSSGSDRRVRPYAGDTDIFIYPGYRFRCVDAMVTNFHLPESTLLMLVSAFAGQDNIKAAYQEAIAMKYRFFSYGDAMFIHA